MDDVRQPKFKVSTWAVGPEIHSEIVDITGEMTRMVIKTQDEQIRKALIDMGWTPPEDKEAS